MTMFLFFTYVAENQEHSILSDNHYSGLVSLGKTMFENLLYNRFRLDIDVHETNRLSISNEKYLIGLSLDLLL